MEAHTGQMFQSGPPVRLTQEEAYRRVESMRMRQAHSSQRRLVREQLAAGAAGCSDAADHIERT